MTLTRNDREELTESDVEMHLDQAALHIRLARDGPSDLDHATPWEYRMPTSDEIRLMREFCGLTQSEVAKAIGYSVNHVTQVETGGNSPGRRYIQAILRLYKKEWPR